MRLLVALLMVPALAGCIFSFSSNPPEPVQDAIGFPLYNETDGRFHYRMTQGDTMSDLRWAPGGLAEFHNTGNVEITIELPDKFLLVTDRFAFAEPTTVAAGGKANFLVPPSAHSWEISLNGASRVLDPLLAGINATATNQFVSGENHFDLMETQRVEFAPREPGQPGYRAAIAYFADYFDDLGYDVEVDPYGTQDATDITGCSPVGLNSLCPESVANVVATKTGTMFPEKVIFVAGGHFDVVPGTTEGAFDDTSGTIATLELARVLAPYNFDYTLKFAVWGGEENGILGSQFWVQTNPQAKAQVVSYYNLDVIGMSWPAPIPKPDPIVIAAGPDMPERNGQGGGTGPIADSLLSWAQTMQRDWFGFPDKVTAPLDGSTYSAFLYEGVAGGQVDGYAGVNAQSDHTPFIAAGIPAYFIFNGDALNNPIGIHNERDTLRNMTKYVLYENEFDLDIHPFISEADEQAAKAAYAASMEATMFFPLYHAILVDLGVYTPPSAASTLP